ncbi:MAG: hypothetical protein RBT41_06260 [Clostridia bacterium]|jgi:CotS family spore coat protein|nr:hypothetical protein [Clostridia bacterium]
MEERQGDSSIDEIMEQILAAYSLTADKISRQGDGWWIVSGAKMLEIRRFKGETDRLQTALSWQRHLQKKRRGLVPEVLPAQGGQDYLAVEGHVYYVLVRAEDDSFLSSEPAHLVLAVKSLADLHASSRGYQTAGHKEALLGPQIIQNRLTSLIWYYKNFRSCRQKSDFAGIYTEYFSFIYDQGQESLQKMVAGGYENKMKERAQILLNTFCPASLAVRGEGVSFLELNKWTIGLEVMDLALFLSSFLPRYKWDAALTLQLLENYEVQNKLAYQEKQLLLAFLRFPYRFWLYAYQYYNRIVSAPELARKLENYIYESYLRDKCLDGLDNWLWRD